MLRTLSPTPLPGGEGLSASHQAFGPHWHGFACWQPHWHALFAAAGVWQPQVQLLPMQSVQVQADFIWLSVSMDRLRGSGRPGLACGESWTSRAARS